MVLIDTSAWIEFLDGGVPAIAEKVDRALADEVVVIGDLIYCEVMQGLYESKRRDEVRQLLLSLPQFDLGGFDAAEKSANNYRRLREKGITIRKTIDVLIGTFCAEHDITLLHNDRDFEAMKKVVGLKTI